MARRSLSRCAGIACPRRSLRLKEVAASFEAQYAKPENCADSRVLSPNQAKEEDPLLESSDSVDFVDTGVTLMDLKFRKRKSFDIKEEEVVGIEEHDDVVNLEETIGNLKAKRAKSSATIENLSKHSSPVVKKEFLTFSGSGLDESIMKETVSNEILVASEFDLSHKKENVDGEIKEFGEKSPIETWLNGSDDENAMMNSSTVLINKCDFDKEYFGEVVDKVSEREDLEQLDNVTSNISSHDVDIVKKEHLAIRSTECESAVSKMVRNLPTDEVPQKDTQQELPYEESMIFEKRDAHLITAENPTEFVESDSKKSTCFSENDSWLVENRNNSFSDTPFNFNSRLVSLLSEFNTYSCDNLAGPTDDSTISLSLENHDNFADGVNFGSIDKNNCSGAIHSHKSLDIKSDGKYNMINESCKLVSQSIQTLSTCSLSQIDLSILSSDSVALFDDVRQASHYEGGSLGGLMAKDYLLDANESDPQAELTSQLCILSRCSEDMPFDEVSDFADAERTSEQVVCHSPVPQLHEIVGISKSISTMETITDFPMNSSLESTQICLERSSRKLRSNRKEISPNSQEKLLRALSNGGLDDVVKLSNISNCMEKLCFGKAAPKKPFEDTFFETERPNKKPKTMNQSLPKSPYTICCNPSCLKNSSIHAQNQDAILFSQRQMQDTENIATKLLKGLNSLKSIVEETILSEGKTSPSKLNFDEIILATKDASKLEVTTKKWLTMMAKDCTRFCKLMRLADTKLASPANDLHKGRKKITFADEAGGALCQVFVYEQEPVAFIFPKC